MEIERAVAVIDTHTGGEPTRIIIGGGPFLNGETVADKWLEFKDKHNDFRSFVMREPRGHNDMFGALITPPEKRGSHFGVLFMDAGGSISMCGHGSIGMARTLVELGMIRKTEPTTTVFLDSPAGLVELDVEVSQGLVGDVTLKNVPAFLYEENVEVEVPSLGRKIKIDIAFGGNFFAIVPAGQLGMDLIAQEIPKLIPLGLEIRDVVNRKLKIQHPVETHIDKVELTEFSLEREGLPTKNLVVFGDGAVDRSPCGTGTCAKMATLVAKGKLKYGEEFIHEGVTGSHFKGTTEAGPEVGVFGTVIPYIKSRSNVTGFNFLLKQKGDDVGDGFFLPR